MTDLRRQREQIENSRTKLDEADGYVNKSLKTLKEMGKRYVKICVLHTDLQLVLMFFKGCLESIDLRQTDCKMYVYLR